MFAQIPNGLGTMLAVMQLVLWCVYYKKGVRKSESNSSTALPFHHDAGDADKLRKQASGRGVQLHHQLSADSNLNHETKKPDCNENDSALMALCRDV